MWFELEVEVKMSRRTYSVTKSKYVLDNPYEKNAKGVLRFIGVFWVGLYANEIATEMKGITRRSPRLFESESFLRTIRPGGQATIFT